MQNIVKYKFINNQRFGQIPLSGIPIFILFFKNPAFYPYKIRIFNFLPEHPHLTPLGSVLYFFCVVFAQLISLYFSLFSKSI